MPNFWAHRICAGLTLEQLEGSPAADIIKRNAVSYRLGSQGADLMYYRPTQLLRGHKGVVYHAKMLHSQPVEKLAAMSRKYLAGTAGRRQFDGTFAYVCGFLCHHAVDQKVHPFIDTKAASLLKHRRIELDFDAYISNSLAVKPGRERQYWAGMADLIGFAGLAQWYNYMFHHLYSRKFDLKSYVRDYRAMRRASVFLNRSRRLEKLKHTDRPVLSEREMHAMLDAAMKGASEAAGMIDRLYRELESYFPAEAAELQISETRQWAI